MRNPVLGEYCLGIWTTFRALLFFPLRKNRFPFSCSKFKNSSNGQHFFWFLIPKQAQPLVTRGPVTRPHNSAPCSTALLGIKIAKLVHTSSTVLAPSDYSQSNVPEAQKNGEMMQNCARRPRTSSSYLLKNITVSLFYPESISPHVFWFFWIWWTQNTNQRRSNEMLWICVKSIFVDPK